MNLFESIKSNLTEGTYDKENAMYKDLKINEIDDLLTKSFEDAFVSFDWTVIANQMSVYCVFYGDVFNKLDNFLGTSFKRFCKKNGLDIKNGEVSVYPNADGDMGTDTQIVLSFDVSEGGNVFDIKVLDDFSESDNKTFLQESDVDWKAVVDKIYKYINYEYNEIGSDDRYFLNNIIKSAVGTDKDTAKQLEKAKREEDKAKQAEKDRLAKQRADREAKGITSYSLRGKKRDVLDGLESNLGKDFYVKEPGIDGILTIRRNDSNTGIRAYLQNKNLPDDVFGLVFEPVISKKISPRMQPIYDLSVGDYKTEIGSLGEFTGKEFKLTDIPKLTDTIKKVLSTEEV